MIFIEEKTYFPKALRSKQDYGWRLKNDEK